MGNTPAEKYLHNSIILSVLSTEVVQKSLDRGDIVSPGPLTLARGIPKHKTPLEYLSRKFAINFIRQAKWQILNNFEPRRERLSLIVIKFISRQLVIVKT